MSKIDVLDHGFVRLVSYTQPVPVEQTRIIIEETGEQTSLYGQPAGWTGDLEIVRNARVSYDADWRAGESESADAHLINYLMRNRHTSPFEAMVFTFEIKCPLFIARQWHRHRTWAYNEISARYAELPEEFYVPRPEHVGKQSKHNKQVRDIVPSMDRHDYMRALDSTVMIRQECERSFITYRALIERGVPREIARSVLPTATYTRYFGTVSLHNLFHFIRLRSHEHAQWEIRQYADALLNLIRPVCPSAVAAFEEDCEPRPWDETIREAIRAGNATREQIQAILEEFVE